jgi:hypothetical protein
MEFYIDNKKEIQKKLQNIGATIRDLQFYRSYLALGIHGEAVELIENCQNVSKVLLERNSKSKKVIELSISKHEHIKARNFIKDFCIKDPKIMEYYIQTWDLDKYNIKVSIKSYPFVDILSVIGTEEDIDNFVRMLGKLKKAPRSKWEMYEEFCRIDYIPKKVCFRNC